MGVSPRGPEQQQCEFVAAIAVRPVVLAGGAYDRLGHGLEQGVAGRVAVGVVEDFERVEVHHQQGERSAGLDHARQVALEGSVVPQAGERVEVGACRDRHVGFRILKSDRRLAGEEFAEFELVLAEMCLGPADSRQVEAADDLAADAERHHDDVVRDARVPGATRSLGDFCGPLAQRSQRIAGLRANRKHVVSDVVGADGVAAPDHPARQSLVVGVSHRFGIACTVGTARQDRHDATRCAFAAIDGQAVVVDDCADRFGDLLKDAPRLERGDELLADVEEPLLGRDLLLE